MKIYYRAKHILLLEDDDTEYIKEKLDSGSTFEDLAKEFSECETASAGGDLGRFPIGTMLPEFERALAHTSVGDITYSIRTKFGFHIILRLE